MKSSYKYTANPTRNPFRWLLACWRVSRDMTNTNEAAIVEIGFSRSWFGRRISGWQTVTLELQKSEQHNSAISKRERLGFVDIAKLGELDAGTLGRALAVQCTRKAIDPNLVHIDTDTDVDFVMAHVFETHDIWHVVTGWGNDEEGEVGLGGFYIAQLQLPLIALMLSLVFLNTVLSKPESLKPRMDALTNGYQMGKTARDLFDVDWRRNFSRSLHEIRQEYEIVQEIVGEGILRDAA